MFFPLIVSAFQLYAFKPHTHLTKDDLRLIQYLSDDFESDPGHDLLGDNPSGGMQRRPIHLTLKTIMFDVAFTMFQFWFLFHGYA